MRHRNSRPPAEILDAITAAAAAGNEAEVERLSTAARAAAADARHRAIPLPDGGEA